MNSTGTPPIVQKNSSEPGNTGVEHRDIVREGTRLLHRPSEVVGHERQGRKALGGDVSKVLGNVEHFDEACLTGADDGDVRTVGWRPAQRLLEHFTGHVQFELDLHTDDVRQESDERLRRMAAHHHVMKLSWHVEPPMRPA